MSTRWFIGLASGSGGDGVDATLLETEGVGLDLRVRPLHSLHQPYGRELCALIQLVQGPAPCEVRYVSLLHRLLGETFAAAARQVVDRISFSLGRIMAVGCPGHTIWLDSEGRFPSTVGLGMAAVVAERTGLTTLSDFRARDLAVGGQGVPLAALTDYLLFRHPSETRVLIHLGGLARVVYLPAGCRLHQVLGFEAGPCNVLLDALMRQITGGRENYDPGGRHAVQGRCIDTLLRDWLLHPALQRRPPRGVPRHLFGAEFAASAVQQARQRGWGLHDLLCTATHFVAQSITASLRRFLPANVGTSGTMSESFRNLPAKRSGTFQGVPEPSGRSGTLPAVQRVLVSGGGVRNGLLWHLLEQDLGGVPLDRTDRYGIPAEARKSLAFGVLAALTVDGVAANVPSATGASASRLLGSLTPGAASNWARLLAWMAAQTAHLTVSASGG